MGFKENYSNYIKVLFAVVAVWLEAPFNYLAVTT